MRAKEKVLNLRPTAFANVNKWGYRILDGMPPINGDTSLSNHQPRESWAWAQAYRNLKK
jgi:hypothetical protein